MKTLMTNEVTPIAPFNHERNDLINLVERRDAQIAVLKAELAKQDNVVPGFPVGTVFTPIGKNRSECTVTDFLVTRNLAGEIVKTCYVASHQFLGQTVFQYDVCSVTIARGIKKS